MITKTQGAIAFVTGVLLMIGGLVELARGATMTNGVYVSPIGEVRIVREPGIVLASTETNNSPSLVSIRRDVWLATTTTATVVRFEYGTNTQFKLEITPDMSPGSWRSLVPGELKGVTLSPPTNAVQWIEYWLDPNVIGTPARMTRIFTNYPQPPPETNQPTATVASMAPPST